MDISSKKLRNTINKFKNFYKIIAILLFIFSLGLIFILENKIDAIIISLIILFIYVSCFYIFDSMKVVFLLQHIREISSDNYSVYEILEKSNEESEIRLLLGKKYKKILNSMYKIEKYIYDTSLKGKQSEKMADTVVEDIGKNLINPVKNIDAGVNELKENSVSTEVLDKIEKEAYYMKDTINELFELSKAITRTMEINIKRLDIVSLVKQGLVEYEDKLYENSIKIKKNIQYDKLFINADGDKLWRVLEILLDNIANHSKENTRAYVDINLIDDNIEVSLSNISKKELNMDVKEFYKILNENNSLGLAIGINLIEAQDAKFNIFIDGDMFKVSMMFKDNQNFVERGDINDR